MPGVWHGSAGSTRAWRKARAYVIARDAAQAALQGRPNCSLRLPGVCVGDAGPRHVHHRRGSNCVDPLDPAELETTCAPCNLAVGDPTAGNAAEREDTAPPEWLVRRVGEQ